MDSGTASSATPATLPARMPPGRFVGALVPGVYGGAAVSRSRSRVPVSRWIAAVVVDHENSPGLRWFRSRNPASDT